MRTRSMALVLLTAVSLFLFPLYTRPVQAQKLCANPDYSLTRKMYDGGTWQPRIVWIGVGVVGSFAVTEVTHRTFGISRTKSAILVTALATSVHLLGVATKQYSFNGPDVLADAWRSAGAIAISVSFRGGWKPALVSIGTWTMVEAVLYPCASP